MEEPIESVLDANTITFREIASIKHGRRAMLQGMGGAIVLLVTMVSTAIFYSANKDFGLAVILGFFAGIMAFILAGLTYNVYMAEMDRLHEAIKEQR